jgi:hypothetical protein
MNDLFQKLMMASSGGKSDVPQALKTFQHVMPTNSTNAGLFYSSLTNHTYFLYTNTIVRTADNNTFTTVYNGNISGTNSNVTIRSMCQTADKLVAVCETGYILTSLDGNNWGVFPTRPATQNLFSVVFANNTIVAVGASGRIVYSVDNGVSFQTTTAGTRQFNSVIHNGTVFAAFGASGAFWTSSNGINWTERSLGSTATINGISKSTTSNTWIIVGTGGFMSRSTSTSLDSWTTLTSGTTVELFSVGNINGTFVVGGSSGYLRHSINDGGTWTQASVSGLNQTRSMASNGSTIIAHVSTTTSVFLSSNDGINWSTLSPSAGNGALGPRSVVTQDGNFVFSVNESQIYTINSTGTSATMKHGFPTNINKVFYDARVNVIAFMCGRGIGSGQAVVYTALSLVNGKPTFTPLVLNNENIPNFTDVADVASNGQISVIVGQSGRIWTTTDYITFTQRTSQTTRNINRVKWVPELNLFCYGARNMEFGTSPNGIDWTARNVRTTAFPFSRNNTVSEDISQIEWAGGPTGRLVIAITSGSSGAILNSTNGATNWTLNSYYGISNIRSLNNEPFVYALFGSYGMSRSSDGINWTPINIARTISSIFKSGSRYMMTCAPASASSPGGIFTSTNGLDWSITNATTSLNYRDITSSGETGRWVAVGDGGIVFTSDDSGNTWTQRTSGTTQQLVSIVRSGGWFVASGDGGAIIRSSDGINWANVSGDTIRRQLVVNASGVIISVPFSTGAVLISTNNGETFTSVSPQPGAANRSYSGAGYSSINDQFIINSFSAVYVSNNGTTWTTRPTVLGLNGTASFVNNKYIWPANDGMDYTDISDNIRSSSNIVRHASSGNNAHYSYRFFKYDDSLFATGFGATTIGFHRTDDGITWNAVGDNLGVGLGLLQVDSPTDGKYAFFFQPSATGSPSPYPIPLRYSYSINPVSFKQNTLPTMSQNSITTGVVANNLLVTTSLSTNGYGISVATI